MGLPISTVWVVNSGNHNYRNAEQFGNLKVLTEGRVNVFSVDNLVADMKMKLKDAQKDDMVLVSGYAVPNALVIHIFLKKFGFCRMLLWEANNRKYMVNTLNDFELEA